MPGHGSINRSAPCVRRATVLARLAFASRRVRCRRQSFRQEATSGPSGRGPSARTDQFEPRAAGLSRKVREVWMAGTTPDNRLGGPEVGEGPRLPAGGRGCGAPGREADRDPVGSALAGGAWVANSLAFHRPWAREPGKVALPGPSTVSPLAPWGTRLPPNRDPVSYGQGDEGTESRLLRSREPPVGPPGRLALRSGRKHDGSPEPARGRDGRGPGGPAAVDRDLPRSFS